MHSDEQFEAIVSEFYKPLFKFAMSLTRSESDAQDLTQQTFYIWATRGHQLRDISKVKTWLFTTLHRAFLQARGRQIKFPHYQVEKVREELPVHYPDTADRIDSSQVLSALDRVDEVYQSAVALYYLEFRSYKDIAEILEVPVGTIKSRIARGIAELRKFLLSECSPASTPDKAANAASAPSRKIGVDATSKEPLGSKAFQDNYEEWDFSSTLLQEPLTFSAG
jgi:RNA polymerase sigma-70 factor (ECF subfamily)